MLLDFTDCISIFTLSVNVDSFFSSISLILTGYIVIQFKLNALLCINIINNK